MTKERLTRQQQKEKTRSSLLGAAEEVFAARGFHGASVEEIAEQAGFTVGAVYSNFESKDELFLALVEERSGERIASIGQTLAEAEPSAEMRMRTAGSLLVEHMHQDRSLWLLFMEFWGTAARDPKMRRKFARYVEAMVESFAKIIGAQMESLGIVSATPPRDIASAAMALADGFMLQKVIDKGAVDDEFYESIFNRFLAALIAPLDFDALAAEAQMSPAGG